MTRAEPGAGRTAARLEALGFEAVVRPLLEIQPIPQAAPTLDGFDALAFTSSNGVAAFAALTAERSLPVFAVGDATAEAARAAGFARVRSAGGDLDDLARRLAETTAAGQAVGRVLAPGAREPAGDLAALLGGTVTVETLAVYATAETGAAPPDAFEAVLLHSPRAAQATAAALDPGGGAGRLAVSISPAAAEPLAETGFETVRVAARPDEAAMLEALGNPAPRV